METILRAMGKVDAFNSAGVRKEMNDFVVVKTHKKIIDYIDFLQKKNAEALSFYPKAVFERELEKGRLYLGLLNNEPCGYVYVGSFKRETRCHQVCVQYDVRRRFYASALINCIEQDAINQNCYALTLRCGFDLQANDFWKSLNYKCVDIQQGGIRRNRKINIWRKQLIPELFEDIHIEPARGKTSQEIWRKNKKTGIVNGFNRGKSLKDYRNIILNESA